MALRPIVRFPDPILRRPTRPVEAFDEELARLVTDMVETMYAGGGAGLAAIQVGDPRRVFIVEAAAAGGDPNDPPIVFVNPEIEWLSEETEVGDEGCLSFPGIYVPVKRSLRARVTARDVRGETFSAEGERLYARAMQHEHDHLINRLLVDYVGPLKRKMIRRKLEREAREGEDAASGGE